MRPFKLAVSWLFFIALVFVPTAIVHADKDKESIWNKLFAPGPLITGHKKLEEGDCLKCHTAGHGLSVDNCLACHKEIKPFVEQKRGFHGLVEKTCYECHSDHKGREYDSTQVDQKTFEHGKMTGYILVGKHAEIKCEECHKEKRTDKPVRSHEIRWLGKQSSCVACHKKNDVHHYPKGSKYFGKDCDACHGPKSWKEDLKFEHERDGKYKLEGKHAKLKCNDCHQDKKDKTIMIYKWAHLPTSKCLTCHQDQHKNNLSEKFRGGDCLKCHNTTAWKMEEGFNHESTGYKLSFKHAEAKCEECHVQPGGKPTKRQLKDYLFAGLKTDCLTCHKEYHFFAGLRSKTFGNLNQCSKCHNEQDWKKAKNFDHNENTRFSIDGKHEDLKCNDCHLPDRAKMAAEKSPEKKLVIVRPPGNVGIYHWVKLPTSTCEQCHANPHIGNFKKELLEKACNSCHTTEGWMVMKAGKGFDHSKTRFPLTGAHTNTKCSDCHNVNGKQNFKFKNFEQHFCMDCHTNVHKGQFGEKFAATTCTECHSTKTFTERLEFDHNKTKYPLEGAHQKVKCLDCHKPTTERFNLVKPNINARDLAARRSPFKGIYQFPRLPEAKCLTCHKDYHKGQLGADCLKCHNVKEWKNPKFDHNTQSRFPLVDKHVGVDCGKCHAGQKEDRKYKPMGMECVDCHKDAHKGAFGRLCQDCHTIRGWRITKDFHKNFTLTGVHYTLECSECHKDSRKLSGLSNQCIECHYKDDIHHGTQPNCKQCHRQFFWEMTDFKHSMTRFPLRGAHRVAECEDCHYKAGTQVIYQGLSPACGSCHAADLANANATVPNAASAHASKGVTPATDCSSCHPNFFSFR